MSEEIWLFSDGSICFMERTDEGFRDLDTKQVFTKQEFLDKVTNNCGSLITRADISTVYLEDEYDVWKDSE